MLRKRSCEAFATDREHETLTICRNLYPSVTCGTAPLLGEQRTSPEGSNFADVNFNFDTPS